MFKLALRYIFRQKVRSGLILSTIIFGVASLMFSGGFIEDIFVQLREATIHSQLGHIQVYKAGYSTVGRREPYEYLISDSERIARELERVPQVKEVMVRLNFSGLANNGRADLPIIGEGIEPDKEARLGSALTVLDGHRLRDEDSYGIMLGQGVAQSLQLVPGALVTLLATTPDGALNTLEFEVMGVFQSISRDYDNRAVRIHLDAAQELINTSGVHRLVFSLEQTSATDGVADILGKQLHAREFEIRKWYELADFYAKTVDLYRRQFGVMNLIILIMVVLSVANSINMAVTERHGEFGTQMALGQRRRSIFWQVILENTVLGFIGAIVGVVVGILLALGVSQMGIEMPPLPNSNAGYLATIHLVPGVTAMAAGIGVVAAVIASLSPAYRVSRLPVADALRENV
jgi:putative ABC transport system permease protein